MKVKVLTTFLKNSVRTLTRIVTPQLGEVIEDPIKIIVKDKKLSLYLTQFDVSMVYETNVEVESEGEFIVSVKVFDGVVSPIIDSVIELSLVENDSVLQIKTESSVSKIKTISGVVDEFPNINTKDIKNKFSIDREVFICGLRTTQHAAATSVVKQELNNILIKTKEKNIYFVATDTFRLAEIRFLVDDKVKDFDVLIPAKNVNKILKILESSINPSVNLVISDEGVCVGMEEGTFFTRSTSGTFPDYKKIIPNNFDINFTVLKHDVLNFFKKAKYFSNTLNTIKMNIDGNHIVLYFDNDTIGSTEDRIPIADLQGGGELPNFNYRFINDAIQVINDEKIRFCFVSGGVKPVLIQGASYKLFTALISPLLNK